MIRTALVLWALLTTSAQALTIDLPGRPTKIAEQGEVAGLLSIPTGAWDGMTVPGTPLRGQVQHQVVHLADKYRPMTLAAALAEQLVDQGYTIALECADRACGGFDFRFALPLIPPPAMFVDLGNFAFISALGPDGDGVYILISPTQAKTHLHISTVSSQGASSPLIDEVDIVEPERFSPAPQPLSSLADALETQGHYVLSDLRFQSGSSVLDGVDFDSLTRLAQYLTENSTRSIAFVGHTDATGGLSANTALSKKRAEAVASLFLTRYLDVPGRVDTDGVGYLAPIAPNTTGEGRAQNRRVEVILTSTD